MEINKELKKIKNLIKKNLYDFHNIEPIDLDEQFKYFFLKKNI